MSERIDWEAIEREYRAGQLSLREIGRLYGITEGGIRKRAKADGWERILIDKVRSAVREKLVRNDGTQIGTRVPDAQVVESASLRGFELVVSHRKDLAQLHALKRILATRLAAFLNNEEPDGPCMSRMESPSDVLEKLSRVTARLIPLERQAHNLDEGDDEKPLTRGDIKGVRNVIADRIAGIASRIAGGPAGSGAAKDPAGTQ